MTAAAERTTPRPGVVVTGIGIISPAGLTAAEAFRTMLEGKSTARTVDTLVAGDSPVTFACVTPPLDTERYVSRRELAQLDRAALLALAAADDAVADAQLSPADARLDPRRVGVAVGTSMTGIETTAQAVIANTLTGESVSAFTVPKIMSNSPAARIALRLGAGGSCLTYSTACASGATAIGEAAAKIRSGELDVVVAGGVDAPVIPLVVSSFHQLRALSSRNSDPGAASRPFDADRDGFVLGEGSAFLVLENADVAAARGATSYGRIAGYATTCDAHHIVAPAPDGQAAGSCMVAAIEDAGLLARDIGHVNAHGTSTLLNDRAEAAALRLCFGDRTPPVTAPKGVVGHLMGAAGAFEAAIALLSADAGQVPPVANFGRATDMAGLDLVAGTPRAIGPAPVLSNSFGFGGHNACLVLTPRGAA